MRRFIAAIFAGLLATTGASAESLAGKVGDRRYPVNFSYTKGNCPDAYKAYIAASGHSAYAQTPKDRSVGGFFCGLSRNAPSQAEAERRALKSCMDTGKRYKFRTVNHCQIYVSK